MQSFGILDNDLCDLSELCWTLGCKILLYMCMCVCMCMWCACVCACVCDVYVCVCACMCVYVCVHMCACVMHATVVKSNLINALGWNTTNFLLLPDWLHTPTSKDSCGHYVPQRYLTHKAIRKEFEHISSEILLVTMCTSVLKNGYYNDWYLTYM